MCRYASRVAQFGVATADRAAYCLGSSLVIEDAYDMLGECYFCDFAHQGLGPWCEVSESVPHDEYTGARFQQTVAPSAYNGPRQQTLYFPERPERTSPGTDCLDIYIFCTGVGPPDSFTYLVFDGDRLVKNVTGQGCPDRWDVYEY
jgi:hypothetical protein